MENQNIENQNGENQQNQQPQQGEQKHQNPGNNRPTGGQQQQERMFTQSELNAIVGDRVNRTKEKYEAKLQELNKQLEEMMTLKKKAEEYDKLFEEFESFKSKYRTEKIQTRFKEKAKEYNIEYLDAAMKLVKDELFGLSVNEDGEVEGLDDLVKKLVEENPFLVKKQEQPKPVGLPSNPSGRVDKSKEQLLKEAYEKARRTGKKEDLLAYSRLKRELNN